MGQQGTAGWHLCVENVVVGIRLRMVTRMMAAKEIFGDLTNTDHCSMTLDLEH